MQPEIHLGGLTLQTFGLMFGLGFLAAGAIIARRMKEIGRPVDYAYEMAFSALVGGIVGARLWWVAENLEEPGDLLGRLFSGAGLVWYGGAIGGAIFVLAWARWRNIFDLTTVDSAAVPLAAGYAIGRIGCQLAGDGDYGENWDGPWAMAYPNGTVAITETVHPTPIYETLAMGLVAYVLWRLRDRFRVGILFALYLVAAGSERFLVEFVRRNDAVVAGLTQPQLVSLVMIAAGLAWIWTVRRRHGSLAPPAPTPAKGAGRRPRPQRARA